MAYVNTSLVEALSFTMRPDVLNSLDGMVLDWAGPRGPVRFFNVYNAPVGASSPSTVLDTLLDLELDDCAALVVGDFNIHRRLWDQDPGIL